MKAAIAAGGGGGGDGVASVDGPENRRVGVVVVGEEESVNREDVPQAQRSAVPE